jgi:hypothetical protein
MTNCFSRLHSPYNDHEAEILQQQLQERLKMSIEEHQKGVVGSVSEEECRVARNRVAKILNIQEKLIPSIRQLAPPAELLENLERVETYVKSDLDMKMLVRLQGLRKRIHLIYPTWIQERSCAGRLRMLPSSMVQLVFELLEPEEIASCMMVCKAWMSDATKNPRVWRGRTLRVYTNPPLFCNPIYREPWTSIALRYVESVAIVCPMDDPSENCFSTSCRHTLQDEGMESTPYACLLRGFKRGALSNIVRVEVDKVTTNSFHQICTVLSMQRGLQSIILKSIPLKLCIWNRIEMLRKCSLRHADIFTLGDFYHINDMFITDLQDALLSNRTLESLVVPIDTSHAQTYINTTQLNQFINVALPTILRGVPGTVPPLKQLEFRFQSTGEAISRISKILQRYGTMGDGSTQLELLQFIHDERYNDNNGYRYYMEYLLTIAADLAIHLSSGPLQPESQLRIEMSHLEKLSGDISQRVYASALEMLTPDERILASQRVLFK